MFEALSGEERVEEAEDGLVAPVPDIGEQALGPEIWLPAASEAAPAHGRGGSSGGVQPPEPSLADRRAAHSASLPLGALRRDVAWRIVLFALRDTIATVLVAGSLLSLVAALQVASITMGGQLDAKTRVRRIDLGRRGCIGVRALVGQGRHLGNGYRCDETAVDPSRQYNGRVFDPSTGFLDYGARMYWPQIGRFISPDTFAGNIKNPASLNRYSYVHNNPYKYTDPTGQVGENVVEALEEAAPEIVEGIAKVSPEAAAVLEEAGGSLAEISQAVGETQMGWANKVEDAAAQIGPKATQLARQLGAAGEKAVRAVRDIGEKAAIRVNGETFVPDGQTPAEVNEVKNVGYQTLTRQLRAFMQNAEETGRRFILWVRGGDAPTKLSGPLQDAMNQPSRAVEQIPLSGD